MTSKRSARGGQSVAVTSEHKSNAASGASRRCRATSSSFATGTMIVQSPTQKLNAATPPETADCSDATNAGAPAPAGGGGSGGPLGGVAAGGCAGAAAFAAAGARDAAASAPKAVAGLPAGAAEAEAGAADAPAPGESVRDTS